MTTESQMDNAGPAMDMLVTALHPPQPAQIVRVQPVNYISMDDFMQEQIKLDEENDLKEGIKSPPAKKQKNAIAIDPETFSLEDEAVKVMGGENWIGLLQRYSDVHPHHKVKYEELTIEKPLPRFQCIVALKDFPERFGANKEQALTFSNKKLAKHYASKQAVDWLRSNNHMPEDGVKFAIPTLLPPPPSELEHEETALLAIGDNNWVGRLDEWVKVKWGGKKYPRYEELIIGTKTPRFQYTVALDGFPISFGCVESESQQATFSSKKPAKQFAAKQVIDWLITNGHMPADGIVSFPKPAPVTQPAIPAQSIPIQGLSYAAQVVDLCHRLSFQAPKYILEPASKIPNCPIWDGYADFDGNPRIGDEGKVGHVRNIIGKKNAKEALAEQVYTFLKGVEAHRLEQYEEEDRKRKRSPDSPQKKELSSTSLEVKA